MNDERVLSLFFGLVFLFGFAMGGWAQQAPERSIINISGDLYRAQNDQHFTVFLVTSEGIIVTDPINRDFSNWLKGELAARFDVPVRYVLYSHHHWDHASGGDVFADTAQFVGHENMLTRLALPPADTPMPAGASGQDANGNGRIELSEAGDNFQVNFDLFDANGDGALSGAEVVRGPVNEVRPPDITYADKTTISLGGKSAELTWTGIITHTDDMSVIRFPGEGVVFVVDFISIKRVPFRTLGSGLLEEWLASMQAVEAMDFEIVVPGHGSVGGKADVAEHRQYFEELRAAVSRGIAAGRSVEQLQSSILMEDYSDWASYDAWRAENVLGMYNLLTE